MTDFDYKQRPWTRPLTDEEYARAVGAIPETPARLEFVLSPFQVIQLAEACGLCGVSGEHTHFPRSQDEVAA